MDGSCQIFPGHRWIDRYLGFGFYALSTKSCDVMQSESTLWKLKFFVKDALQVQSKSSPTMGGNNNNNQQKNNNSKRKREICDALAKTSQKRNKKLSP